MLNLTTVIVTVIGVGGPHGVPPQKLSGAVVRVTYPGVARQPLRQKRTDRDGRLSFRLLGPGTYKLWASLMAPQASPTLPCQMRTISIGRRAGIQRVSLHCAIR